MVKNLPAIRRPGFDPWVGKIPWRRAWQPTPVFLPGKFHGQRNLAGCSPWGHKEPDTDWVTRHRTFRPDTRWTLMDQSRFQRVSKIRTVCVYLCVCVSSNGSPGFTYTDPVCLGGGWKLCVWSHLLLSSGGEHVTGWHRGGGWRGQSQGPCASHLGQWPGDKGGVLHAPVLPPDSRRQAWEVSPGFQDYQFIGHKYSSSVYQVGDLGVERQGHSEVWGVPCFQAPLCRVPWGLPGRWAGQASESCACVLNHFSSVQPFVIPWIVAHQAPLSTGFSRQESWSGLPCLHQRIFPTQDRTHISYVSCIGRQVLK